MSPMMLMLLLGLGMEGSSFLNQALGQRAQTKLQKEGLALEREKMKAEEKGTARAYKEQRAMATEAFQRAREEKVSDRQMEREQRMYSMAKDSADRQTAMMLSLIQGLSNNQRGMIPGGGMPSIPELLR